VAKSCIPVWRMCSLALSIYYSEHAEDLSLTPVLQLHSDRPTRWRLILNNYIFLPQCSVFCWFWVSWLLSYIYSMHMGTCTHSTCEPEVSRLGQYNFRLSLVTGCYFPSEVIHWAQHHSHCWRLLWNSHLVMHSSTTCDRTWISIISSNLQLWEQDEVTEDQEWGVGDNHHIIFI